MAKHLDLGRRGESLAKALLESSGYEIMDENDITSAPAAAANGSPSRRA